MLNECFSSILDAVSRRKRLVVGLLAIVTVGAGIDLGSISLDNNVDAMFPEDDEILRSMRFLRESHLSDRVILSLELNSSEHSEQDLLRAGAELEAHLGPPFVTEVVGGIPATDVVEEMLSLLRYIPQLLDEEALARLGRRITPQGVEASLRRNFNQLVKPASTFMLPLIRSDPLGISFEIFRSLERLSSSLGYEVEVEGERFISRDRAHTMLIVQTPIGVTDASGSRELVEYLRGRLRELPDFVAANIIGGHLHSISNENVVKRDIWLALSIASLAFLLLFLLRFRDIRAIMLFLLPLVSVLISIRISYTVLGRLSYFIIGMGGVVAGIAVDYGIHVYVAVRSAGGEADAVKLVAKPVVIGALTTLGVFAAFFFSSVQGYHQLALFSIVSILLCLGCALFVLPHLLGHRDGATPGGAAGRHGGGRSYDGSRLAVACWVLAMAAGVASAARVTFDSDIEELDGSEPQVFQAEEEFHRVWGGEDEPAVLVVPGRSLDAALRLERAVYRDARAVIGEEKVARLSAIWVPREERVANAARWREFWRQGRQAELERLLREQGAAYNFSSDAFSPFLESLHAVAAPTAELESVGVLSRLRERFVQEGKNGYRLLSFFPDEDRFVSELSLISRDHPGTFVVSRNALSQALSRSVASEIVYLAAIAALLIPALAFLLLRDLRLTMLSLVPVVTGIVAVLGVIPVLGLSLSAPNVISAMVVVGLCIDYGIFMVYACHYGLKTGTRTAVTLSAVTTLIGTGALLLARHPVLFAIGVTMVSGVLAGYTAAMTVVPSLHQWFLREGGAAS